MRQWTPRGHPPPPPPPHSRTRNALATLLWSAASESRAVICCIIIPPWRWMSRRASRRRSTPPQRCGPRSRCACVALRGACARRASRVSASARRVFHLDERRVHSDAVRKSRAPTCITDACDQSRQVAPQRRAVARRGHARSRQWHPPRQYARVALGDHRVCAHNLPAVQHPRSTLRFACARHRPPVPSFAARRSPSAWLSSAARCQPTRRRDSCSSSSWSGRRPRRRRLV